MGVFRSGHFGPPESAQCWPKCTFRVLPSHAGTESLWWSPVIYLLNQHPKWWGTPVPLDVGHVLLYGSILRHIASTALPTHPLPITCTEATRFETPGWGVGGYLSCLSLTSCIQSVIRSHRLSLWNFSTMHCLTYPFLLCPPKPESYHFISMALTVSDPCLLVHSLLQISFPKAPFPSSLFCPNTLKWVCLVNRIMDLDPQGQ